MWAECKEHDGLKKSTFGLNCSYENTQQYVLAFS